MGTEFLMKSSKSFRKHIDKKRAELATPTLFTQSPNNEPRCAIASVVNLEKLKCGDKLIVEFVRGNLSGYRENKLVAQFRKPSTELVKAISEGAGVAKGEVKRCYKISNTVDIAIW